jgi:hypothetical protein
MVARYELENMVGVSRERIPLPLSKHVVESGYMYKQFKGRNNKVYSLKSANGELYHSIGSRFVLSGWNRDSKRITQ